MQLTPIPLELPDEDLPHPVDAFLREAEQRTSDMLDDGRGGNDFIPCDGMTIYLAMQALQKIQNPTGKRFCEWGSGMGMATGLAALLGWEATGIEIEPVLVKASRQLLQDFDLPATIHHGSYDPDTPPGLPNGIKRNAFDLVFVYAWPGQEENLMRVFEQHAAPGALFLIYHGIEDIRLYQIPA